MRTEDAVRTDWTNTKVRTLAKSLVSFYYSLIGAKEVKGIVYNNKIGVCTYDNGTMYYYTKGSEVDLGNNGGQEIRDVTQEVTSLYKEHLAQEDESKKEPTTQEKVTLQEAASFANAYSLKTAIQTIQSYLKGSGVELQIFEDRLDVMCLSNGYDGDSLRVESVGEVVEFVEAVKTLKKLGYK